MRNVAIIFSLVFVSIGIYSFKNSNTTSKAHKPTPSAIEWISWEEMLEKSKTEQRKVVVDVYTDWCGWCKRMDATTFRQPQIAKYINQKYYAVKFNAEMKEDLNFKGKTFKFVKNGMRGYHELAAEITRGRLSYPTVVFLDEQLEVIQSIPGYRDAGEFEKIITYFGENAHQKTPWETYQKNYRPMKVD